MGNILDIFFGTDVEVMSYTSEDQTNKPNWW